MSAIWGAISLDGRPLPPDVGERMKRPYETCRIDGFRSFDDGQVMLGCGVQYFTKEAKHEVLPISDSGNRFFFTADIILDNRAELLRRLELREDDGCVPDGTIAFEMMRRYGEDCLNDLLGSYAFVFYDRLRRRVSMVADATGTRLIYYRLREGVLYFSSLVKPILDVSGNDGVNGHWIADFLALDNLSLMTQAEESAYAGVSRLAPRQVVSVQDGQISKRLYWNPEVREVRLKNDAEYAEKLKEVFRESIRCLLRDGRPALHLSGGLDSTAVACYAVPALKESGQALHTYTSVPEKSFRSDLPRFFITDESGHVLKTKEFLEQRGISVHCRFTDSAGTNCWDGRAAEMKAMEIPYKSLQNMIWLVDTMDAAYADGSRILLNGGYGNLTISNSGRSPYLNDLFRHGRLVSFARQAYLFERTHGIRRKKSIHAAWLQFLGNLLPQRPGTSDTDLFGDSFVSGAAVERFGLRASFAAQARINNDAKNKYYDAQVCLYESAVLRQKGEVNVKHSLLTGVTPRDPAMDKRLIEFCLSLPPGHYARDGIPRRLVRAYLKDEMPPHVMSPRQLGLQGADAVTRVAAHWERIYEEMLAVYRRNADSPFVDCERAVAELEKMNTSPEKAELFTFFRLGYTAMTLEFLEQIEEGRRLQA